MAAISSSSAVVEAAAAAKTPQMSATVPLLSGTGGGAVGYRLDVAAGISATSVMPSKSVRDHGSVTVNISGPSLSTGPTVSKASNAATDLRLRSASGPGRDDEHISNIITSFKKPQFTFISKLVREVRCIFKDRRAKRSLYLMGFNVIGTCLLSSLCRDTNSMALLAYTYLVVFQLFILLTCPLSVWVEQQRPTSAFTFGYGRFEVLAVFSCTVLASVGSLFIFKDCAERLMLPQQPIVHGKGVITGIIVAFVVQLVVIYGTDSKAWTHVIRSSKSSCLQVWLTELSENLCQFMPGLSRFLLPRINPFILLTNLGAAVLLVAHWIVELKRYHAADTFAAVAIVFLTCIALLPMSVYTGMILLQTTPSHVLNQLEKCLREAATLDGVLEFRNEHFWTVSFGVMAGSLHVRVRRDANEQLVLSHLTSRLSSLIHVLTIQVFKDDWTRSSATTMQLLSDSARITASSAAAAAASASTVTPQWLPPAPKPISTLSNASSDFSTLAIFADRQQVKGHRPSDRNPAYSQPRV